MLDLLYPPRCAGCGRVGALFCTTCLAQVVPITPPVCTRCGRPGIRDGLCRLCRRQPSPLDGITAGDIFAPPLRSAIHYFKYRGARRLAPLLGARLVDEWRKAGLAADAIVPVPLHVERERERGYNQSALLARVLGHALNIPVAEDWLVRQRDTQPQVALSRVERKQNVTGAFLCARNVIGTRIVLVDDVCTTGATLEACAAALHSRGAAHVWGLTLARPRWDPAADAAELA